MSRTKEQAEAFLRKVLGAPKRKLVGDEYKQVRTMLQLMEPTTEYNNQRSWTEEYKTVGNPIWYRVTYWPIGGELEVEIEVFGEEGNE